MGHDGIWWDTQLAWYHIVGIAKGNLLAIWVGRSSNWCVLLEGWLALLPVREDYGGKCGSSLSNIFFFGVVSLSFVVFLFSVVSCCWLVGIVFFKPLVAKLLQYPSSGLMRACGHFGVMSFCIFLLKTCPRFRMTAFIFVLSFLLGAWIFFSKTDLCHCISPFVPIVRIVCGHLPIFTKWFSTMIKWQRHMFLIHFLMFLILIVLLLQL